MEVEFGHSFLTSIGASIAVLMIIGRRGHSERPIVNASTKGMEWS